MFSLLHSTEQKSEIFKKKLNELEIQNEVLDNEGQVIFETLDLSPEEITLYLANPENFTKPQWDFLQEFRTSKTDRNSDYLKLKTSSADLKQLNKAYRSGAIIIK